MFSVYARKAATKSTGPTSTTR